MMAAIQDGTAGIARWGIIGIGKLADVAIAPAILSARNSELVAVCSRDAERAVEFAERHCAGYAFDDYSAMLDDDLVDIVYISSPNSLHYEHAISAIRAGKHVLVDKPLALSADDGRALVDAARNAGVRLGVGFQLRHKATNIAARAAIADGAIGEQMHYQMLIGAGKSAFPFDTWRADPQLAGGGTLLNQGTHAFDLVEYLAGSRIAEVASMAESDRLEEVFVAACRLENGALATIACDQVLGGTRRDWTGIGAEGWLEARGCLGAPAGDSLVLHRAGESSALSTSVYTAYEQEVYDFAEAVVGGAPVNGDGGDGVRSIVLVEALYAAARDGRRRLVPDV